jgi:hypothetical protein
MSYRTMAQALLPRRLYKSVRILSSIRDAARAAVAWVNGSENVSRQPACRIENLESRQLLSVTLDANGWTVITPEVGDRVVYVSSSQGKDTNTGLSPTTPVKSLQRGKSLIRSGHGDEMLLKAGDTWHDSFSVWTSSGKSATDPVLISSYGTGARPLIETGMNGAIQTGVVGATTVNNVAIIGLHFYADGRDPNSSSYTGTHPASGINWLTQSNGLLIENTLIEDYANGINLQGYYGTISNVKVRRSTIINSWSTAGHSQGLYGTNVSNLLIEGNTFDHNGYNEKIKGAGQVITNHNIYLASDTSGVIVRDNVISRASAYGLQARGGGIIQNNLFLNNPMGMSFGLVNGATTTAGGVSGSVTGNVFMGSGSVGSTPGVGLELGNLKPGAGVMVANNVFANGTIDNRSAIVLTYGTGVSNSSQAVGINDLTIQNNSIYNWHGGVRIDGGFVPGGKGPTAINRVKIINNTFQLMTGSILSVGGALVSSQETWSGNIFSGWTSINGNSQYLTSLALPSFDDPTRNVSTYDATVGMGANLASFLSCEFQQCHLNWKQAFDAQSVVNYLMAGFK